MIDPSDRESGDPESRKTRPRSSTNLGSIHQVEYYVARLRILSRTK